MEDMTMADSPGYLALVDRLRTPRYVRLWRAVIALASR